jgi:hypothetical protein
MVIIDLGIAGGVHYQVTAAVHGEQGLHVVQKGDRCFNLMLPAATDGKRQADLGFRCLADNFAAAYFPSLLILSNSQAVGMSIKPSTSANLMISSASSSSPSRE